LPLAYLFYQVSISRFVTLKVLSVLVCALLVYYSLHMTIAYRSPWDGPGFGWTEFWVIVEKGFF